MNAMFDQKTWFSDDFTRSYQVLDEGWQTKRALYQELYAVARERIDWRSLQVLDLGGGMGTLASVARELFTADQIRQWVVFDQSLPMMRQGSVYAGRSSAHAEFVVGDLLSDFPFPEAAFDVVFSTNVLYQFADGQHSDHIVPEILRVLKPNGLLVTSNPTEDPRFLKIFRLEGELRSQRMPALQAYRSVLRDLWQNAAFLSAQYKLVASTNKKGAQGWADLYEHASAGALTTVLAGLSKGYAGQASVVVWRKTGCA